MSLKRLGLWSVCVFFFVATYSFFAGTSRRVPAIEGVAVLLPVVLFGLFFVVFFWMARRWNARNDLGVTYLHAGQLERARGEFEQAHKAGFNKVQKAVSRYNLGLTLTALGEVEAAVKELEAVEKSKGLKFSTAYHAPLPNHLALACALNGDLQSARRWLQEGDTRRGNQPANFTLLPEVILLCRDGHPAAAAHLVNTRWRDAEVITVRQFKMLKVVEAFALHLDDASTHAQRIAEALGASRPMDASTYKALTGRWPELSSFLEGRQLVPAAA